MPQASIYQHYEPAVTPEADYDGPRYWLAFQSTQMLVRVNGEKCTIPVLPDINDLGISPVRIQYLGKLYEKPCYSAEIRPGTLPPEGMAFRELRSLYSVLDEGLFWLAGRAIQIANWDQTHQFCGRCGQQTLDVPDERARKCPACGLVNYPRIAPAVITAILKEDKILLSHNIAFAGNRHSLIAGFVEPGETLEECAKREIFEEVGIRVKNLRYFGSQSWPFPNSLMLGFLADYDSGEIKVDGKEITSANWYDVNNLPELPPRMSIAREIIDWFVNGRSAS
jgi:NAD+ diphosphatase